MNHGIKRAFGQFISNGSFQTHESQDQFKRINWTSQDTVARFVSAPVLSQIRNLEPRGGEYVETATAVASEAQMVEVDTEHAYDSWAIPIGRTIEYHARIAFEIPDVVKALWESNGSLTLSLEFRIQRVEVEKSGQSYYGIEDPLIDINLGSLLRHAVQLSASSYLSGRYWIYKTVIAGVVDHIPDVYLTFGASWKCWHLVTTGIDTSMGCVAVWEYGFSRVSVTRVRPREQEATADEPALGEEWALSLIHI